MSEAGVSDTCNNHKENLKAVFQCHFYLFVSHIIDTVVNDMHDMASPGFRTYNALISGSARWPIIYHSSNAAAAVYNCQWSDTLPCTMARASMPPVLVPAIQSKQLRIGCPAAFSIAFSSWMSTSPLMPPPSRHRIWNKCI